MYTTKQERLREQGQDKRKKVASVLAKQHTS
jgi:hypothetical protein